MIPSQETPQFIAPNGCVYCKEEQRNHGMKFSKEHRGIHTYVAPTNEVRLERMKTNRALRQQNK